MKSLNSDKILKLALSLAIILINLSVVYNYLVFIPKKEKNKMEWEKQQIIFKENKQIVIRQQIQECKNGAQTIYEAAWAEKCQIQHDSQAQELKKCLHEVEVNPNILNGPLAAKGCRDTWLISDYTPNCLLTRDNSSYLEKQKDKLNEDCYKFYQSVPQ